LESLSIDIYGKHLEGHQVLTIGTITLITLSLIKRYCSGGRCDIKRDLNGKTAVITGGNTGIGK